MLSEGVFTKAIATSTSESVVARATSLIVATGGGQALNLDYFQEKNILEKDNI